MAPLMVLMKANLRVPCLDIYWDKKLVLHLDLLMVLWTEIKMAFWMVEHSGSYLVHLMDLCLALMKASYSALLMLKYLALHLELWMISHLDSMKELGWVLHMAPLMVLMKANLRFPCLDLDWDKKLVLHLDL